MCFYFEFYLKFGNKSIFLEISKPPRISNFDLSTFATRRAHSLREVRSVVVRRPNLKAPSGRGLREAVEESA